MAVARKKRQTLRYSLNISLIGIWKSEAYAMFDIYSFLPPETAEYNRKAQHEFSPLEQACIVCHSGRLLTERLEAYKELESAYPQYACDDIDLYSDEVKGRIMLKERLSGLISYYENELHAFAASDAGDIYMLRYYRDTIVVFGSYEKAAAYAAEKMAKYGDIPFCTVKKLCPRNGEYEEVGEETLVPGGVLKLSKSDRFEHNGFLGRYAYSEEGFLERYFVDVPLPFNKGDILRTETPFGNGEPFVLLSTMNDKSDMRLYERLIRRGDCSDMSARGLFSDSEGIYEDNVFPYVNFVRAPEDELKDERLKLKWVSKFYRGELTVAELVSTILACDRALSLSDYMAVHGRGGESPAAPIKAMLRMAVLQDTP